MAFIDLVTGKVKYNPVQSDTRVTYYANPNPHKGFKRNLNLYDGLVLIKKDQKVGFYDGKKDQQLLATLPEGYSWDDFGYARRVFWKKEDHKLYIIDETSGIYQWDYKTESQFSKVYSGSFRGALVFTDDWISVNQANEDHRYSAHIFQARTERRYDIADNHVKMLHRLGDSSDMLHLLMEGLDVSTREEVTLNLSEGVLINRRSADWDYAVAEDAEARYRFNNGYAIRQGKDYINPLHQWAIQCELAPVISDDGSLHCINKTSWLRYSPENSSTQKYITLPGFITKYLETAMNKLWVISNDKGGKLFHLSVNKSTFHIDYQHDEPDQCFVNLRSEADELSFLTTGSATDGFFVGGPCQAEAPFQVAAALIEDNGQLNVFNSIVNLSVNVGSEFHCPIMSLVVFIPTPASCTGSLPHQRDCIDIIDSCWRSIGMIKLFLSY